VLGDRKLNGPLRRRPPARGAGQRRFVVGTVDVGTVDVGTVDVGTVDVGTVDVGTVDVGTLRTSWPLR
jgi:hypothetical protein